MAEDREQELVMKLADSRENLNILQNMLKKDLHDVEQKLRLATNAKQSVSDVLYELTGNEFYRNT
jgi:hypothetical protein